MTTISLDRTLGELVAELPTRAGVLEALGLDFCCGGAQPLEVACREAGLDPATVARLLDRPPIAAAGGDTAEPDVRAMSLTELVDHIESTHHVFMKEALPRLAGLAAKVSAAHGPNHPEVRGMQEVLAALTGEIEMHLGKEEQMLFPAIRSLDETRGAAAFHCGHLSNPVRVMEFEHDQAGEALARLRELSGGYALPADACGTFQAYYAGLQELERDLHRHIHKENNVLFPRALELAGDPEDDALAGPCGP
jgi:regulator of cell morphogenesis and NO signaling